MQPNVQVLSVGAAVQADAVAIDNPVDRAGLDRSRLGRNACSRLIVITAEHENAERKDQKSG